MLLSATVAPCATAALLVAMALSGAGVVPVVAVAAAAAVLHVAAWRADRQPVGAFVAAAGAMAVLALVPMPGWSSGVWLPSSACYLLVSWRVVVAGPRSWVGRALVVGVAGVALTAGAAAVRARGGAAGGAAAGGAGADAGGELAEDAPDNIRLGFVDLAITANGITACIELLDDVIAKA